MAATIPPPSLRTAFRNPYIVLRYDALRRLVVLIRTAAPYESLGALRETFAGMDLALAHLPRAALVLLVDSRASPVRNDAAFEEEFNRLRQAFTRGFRKVAILVQTAVGVLQINRQARIDGVAMGIFSEPGQALSYLGLDMDPARLDIRD